MQHLIYGISLWQGYCQEKIPGFSIFLAFGQAQIRGWVEEEDVVRQLLNDNQNAV